MKTKFEAGKFYRTSNGNKAEIYKIFYNEDGSIFKIHGCINSSSTTWIKGGTQILDRSDNSDSLVEEWIERPIVDWKALPAWAQWVALDKEGQWFWYLNKPTFDEEMEYFVPALTRKKEHFDGDSGEIHKNFLPIYNGSWKDSLVQRS